MPAINNYVEFRNKFLLKLLSFKHLVFERSSLKIDNVLKHCKNVIFSLKLKIISNEIIYIFAKV